MNLFDINENIECMKKERLNIADYRSLKRTIQVLGRRFEITDKKRKVQKKLVTALYEQLQITEELRPIFLSNLFIYDDREFLAQIEEAKNFGCKKEEFDKYLRINYHIPKGVYYLKLAEMETYISHYSMTTLADKVKQTLKYVKPEVKITTLRQESDNRIYMETDMPRQFQKQVQSNDKVA